jgi:hypothetical protein
VRASLRLIVVCAVFAGALSGSPAVTAAGSPTWVEPYRDPAARLIGEAVSSTFAWQRLAVLTDTIGNRLKIGRAHV